MKRVRVRSMEEFRALPEGEWVEVIGGMKWSVPDEPVRVEKGKLVVDLSKGVRKAFKAKPGETLEAEISGKSLVVTRRRAKRTRQAG